jgi:chromosome segregation ATPase
METEAFEQLKREYRHMELNRKAYADESHQVLRKQQINIEKLRRDNEALKTEMAMEMRNHASAKPMRHTDDITKLHDEADRYTQYVELERRNIKVMEEQIALMQQKSLHQRKTMGGVNAARDNQAMVQKQIRILENRLDKALVKFNEALAHNKRLRETIDDLRRERVVFDNIYRKARARRLHFSAPRRHSMLTS